MQINNQGITFAFLWLRLQTATIYFMMNVRLFALCLILGVCNSSSWALSSSDVSVSLATSPHFILDHNKPCEEGPSASYVGIKVTNTSGAVLNDVTVTLTTLSSTSSRAATLSDSVLFIGTMVDNASKTAYYYIKYPCSDAVDIDFTFVVSDNQSGTVSFNTTVTSKNTISASAGGQVDSRTTDTSVILGGLISDTITYSFGNIQVGDEIEFQPSGDSLFDPNQLVLLNCKIISSDIPINVPVGTEDKMYFVSTKKYTGTNKKVKVVFFFVNKMTSGTTTLSPFAALTSGNNLKYSGNFGSGLAYKTIASVTNTTPFEVNRSIDNAIVSANDTVIFTVDIVNTSAETIMFDEIVETLDTGYTFVEIQPESEVTSAILTDEPATSSTEEISFVGGVEEATFPYQSYTVEPSDTVTLVYSAVAPSTNTTLDETTTEVMVGGTVGGDDESESCVGCGALPVELLFFDVSGDKNERSLIWSTASELNCDYFEVARSVDGNNFEHIGTMNGQGTTVRVTVYNYSDHYPINETVYYRLRQYDYDGTYFDYFASIRVANETSGVIIAPNPANNQFSITVHPGNDLNKVDIYTTMGKHVLSINTFGSADKIDISSLPSGMYLVDIETINRLYRTRLLKND